MFGFKAYFWGNDVYINEKYRYDANEILTAYLNDSGVKRVLKADYVGKLKEFKRRLTISPYMDYYDFSEYLLERRFAADYKRISEREITTLDRQQNKKVRTIFEQEMLQTRDPIKDYFPLPNEIFCLNLSYGEMAVYSYLLYRENRKKYQCHPSYKTIGKALKISRNTVCKYIRQLEEKELIATKPTNVFTKGGKKLNGNLLYTILPIEQAKQYFYKRQLKNIDQVIAEDKH